MPAKAGAAGLCGHRVVSKTRVCGSFARNFNKFFGFLLKYQKFFCNFAADFYLFLNFMHIPSLLRRSFLVLIPLLLCIVFASPEAKAQRMALKTNTVEYLILSPNLTYEARLSRVLSLQIGLAMNPISKDIAGFKAANFRVEPELRYWFNRPMARHFVAFSATAGAYSLQFKDRFIKGDAVGAGFSYGYAWVLSKHWNMEAEIGVGLATIHAYDYKGKNNCPGKANYRKVLPVPIRFGFSFAYVFK